MCPSVPCLRERRYLDVAFRGAYAVALAASVVTSALTYLYVGAGARELNPVVRALIATVGLGGMVLVRTAVLIGCYRAYAALAASVPNGALVAAFAWLGSLVYLFDVAHDLRVALLAGPVAPASPVRFAGLLAVAVAAGVLFRPRSPAFAS